MDKLTEKIKELEKKTNEVNKVPVTDNPVVTTISPISGIKTGTLPQTSVRDIGKSCVVCNSVEYLLGVLPIR